MVAKRRLVLVGNNDNSSSKVCLLEGGSKQKGVPSICLDSVLKGGVTSVWEDLVARMKKRKLPQHHTPPTVGVLSRDACKHTTPLEESKSQTTVLCEEYSQVTIYKFRQSFILARETLERVQYLSLVGCAGYWVIDRSNGDDEERAGPLVVFAPKIAADLEAGDVLSSLTNHSVWTDGKTISLPTTAQLTTFDEEWVTGPSLDLTMKEATSRSVSQKPGFDWRLIIHDAVKSIRRQEKTDRVSEEDRQDCLRYIQEKCESTRKTLQSRRH